MIPKHNWNKIHSSKDITNFLMGPLFNFLFEKQDKYSANFIIGSKGKVMRGDHEDDGYKDVDELARILIVLNSDQDNYMNNTRAVFPNKNSVWKTFSMLG